MPRIVVRHNGFLRPCRQVFVDIQPADELTVAHQKVIAAAGRALDVAAASEQAKLYSVIGAEVDATLIEKDDILCVAFYGTSHGASHGAFYGAFYAF